LRLRSVFLNRNYGLTLCAYALSLLGTNMSFVAIVALLYSRTGKALDVGVYTVVNIVAGFISGPIAGVVADRVSRKRLMCLANLANAGLIGLLVFANESIYVYAVGFAITFVNRFFVASRMSLLPSLVNPRELVSANAHMTTASLLARIVGPAVAGIIVALVGPMAVFILDSASYILGALLIATVKVAEPSRRPSPLAGVIGEMGRGVAYLFTHPLLRYLVCLGMVHRIFLSMLTPLLIGFVAVRLSGGTGAYGLILSAASAGGLVGSLLAKRLESKRVDRLNLAAWGITFTGVVVLAFLMSRTVAPAALLYACYHVVLFASIINIHTSVQEVTPEAMRGKVFGSIGSVFGPTHLLSMLVGSALADIYGVRTVLVVSALGFVVISTILTACTGPSRAAITRGGGARTTSGTA